MRCIECGEHHEGDCDPAERLAFILDCAADAFDEVLGLPPEPGGRRWLIERGEYPAGEHPGCI